MEVGSTPLRGAQLHQMENNLNLGVANCLSQSDNTPGEADQGAMEVCNAPLRRGRSHQLENNANLVSGSPGGGVRQRENCLNLGDSSCHTRGNNGTGEMEVGNAPLRGGQSHQLENNINLGVGNYHTWSNAAPGEADQGGTEVCNAPLRGAPPRQIENNANPVSERPGGGVYQQENHLNLGVGNCLSRGSDSPGEQQQNSTDLGVGNWYTLGDNSPGEQQEHSTDLVKDSPGGGLHQQEHLGAGNCHTPGNTAPEEADQGKLEVSNSCGGKCHPHQQENHIYLGVGNSHSQSNNTPGADAEYNSGSGDHPCQREMEIDETPTGITVNSRSGGVIEAAEEIVHLRNGESERGGTGDCPLENEETKGQAGGEQMQERAFVSGAESGSESGTEIGRSELASVAGERAAGNGESTPEPGRVSKGEMRRETGENGTDAPAEEAAERGSEEETSPALQAPGVNCVAKECTLEESCLETETLEEKGRRPKMSAVETSDKFTQWVSTETRLQEVKMEAMQKEESRSSGESCTAMSSEGDCQSLLLAVARQEDKATSGQTSEGRDVSEQKENSKGLLDGAGAADSQLDKACSRTESDSEGPSHPAASPDRLQTSTSPCDGCSEHSASPRMRLDLLSPLGADMAHPLALTPSTPEQADDSTLLSADGRAKLGVKRVTFPSDEAIVSGAVEPKDPWRHAQNVTVEEIIAAYKMACQKLNCKPINKLLKQIQEFKELSQRLDCLDLKGEKLDYKASEALEEVFKRVQFKLVDLEATNLDEDGASALFDMIEYYESATQLNISFNKHIGTRGWQAAAHMMRKTSCLQYLDARNTPLLDHSAPFVARALRISSSLVVLHLENASLSGRPLMLLATALKMNMTLRELFLADNKLNGLQDSAQLGNLLKFNCTIQLMDLRNNHILDSGLAYISDGLKEQRQGLVTLVLWNNQLTHNGMTYMAAALPYTLSLETLNLGHNAVGNEGVHKLKDGLIANRSVLRLGLASTKLACEGAVAVAEFIADSPRLLRLDLRENEIKTGGLMALSLALKVNHSLLRLDLDREPKKETVKSFIETQKALLTEIQNGCKRNFILAKEKEEKEHKMQQSASMPEITVTLCDNTEPPQRSQVCLKTQETPKQLGNGVAQESVPSVTGNTEELGSTAELDVAPSSVECNAQPAAQAESVRRTPQPSVVGTPDSEKQQPQHQDPSETPSGKESVTDCDAGDESSPAAVSEQRTQIATELKSAGSESPVLVSLPIEIPQRNNERLVSSPGRGHKIFVVTRVESPPEVPNSQDTRCLKEALQSRKNRTPAKEAESSSEPLPSSAADTQTALTAPASASDGSLQSGSPSDLDNTGHDFETVCAKDCDHVVRGTPLPNGLKAELVHRLPESTLLTSGRDGRAVNCSVEHEFTSPKTEKELEELLLEASQETCRETS